MTKTTGKKVNVNSIQRLRELAKKIQSAGFDLRVGSKKVSVKTSRSKKTRTSKNSGEKGRGAKIASIKKKLRQELS